MAGRISEKKSGWDRLLRQQNEDSVCRGSLSSIVGLVNRKNMQEYMYTMLRLHKMGGRSGDCNRIRGTYCVSQ